VHAYKIDQTSSSIGMKFRAFSIGYQLALSIKTLKAECGINVESNHNVSIGMSKCRANVFVNQSVFASNQFSQRILGGAANGSGSSFRPRAASSYDKAMHRSQTSTLTKLLPPSLFLI
jgi:hypothetical protein